MEGNRKDIGDVMKKNHLKEIKYVDFFRRHSVVIAAALVAVLIAAYFVNIIFFENKKVAVSVLVLTPVSDVRALEEEILKIIDIEADEEIGIQFIDTGVIANQAIATTWIRAKTVDVIIGDREQIKLYAQAGYLKDLKEIEEEGVKDVGEDYMSGLAEYDNEGKVVSLGEEKCFGKYTGEIAGINIKHPVIALAANVTNQKNAVKMLFLSER